MKKIKNTNSKKKAVEVLEENMSLNIHDPMKGLRKGQFVFNFLEWLKFEKKYDTNQQTRMADPFHIPDQEWDILMAEFMKEQGLT